MYNYLGYLGLGFVGYFIGFRFILLLVAAFNAYNCQNVSAYYRLFMAYLFYSMTIFDMLYFFALSYIYTSLSEYDKYRVKVNSLVNEYNTFMRYYDEETGKDGSKASVIVEYWKKVIVVYNQYVKLYPDFIKRITSNKY